MVPVTIFFGECHIGSYCILNSIFIRWYDKIIDKYIEIYPRWKKFAEKFEDNNERK